MKDSESGTAGYCGPSTKRRNSLSPAKEHPFEVTLRATRPHEKSAMSVHTPTVALQVVVTLANGDRYMQQFAVPVRF